MWKLTRKTGFCLTFLMTLGAIIVGSNGKPPSRIRGGQDAASYEGAFVVRIGGCTGAIVGPRHILTAGHCLDNAIGGSVIGGTHHRADENPIVSRIAKVYKHPRYGTAFGGFDVGIAEVDRDLDLSGRQIAVPLTTREINFDSIGFAFGWSRCKDDNIQTLQKVLVSFLRKDLCNKRGGTDQYPQILCVDTERAEVCGGDSGGPIVSGGRLVGILTTSANNVGEPAGAQNVYHYLPWINSILPQ